MTMCEFAYMKLYPADLIADTTELSAADFGSYMLLLIGLWRKGGRLRLQGDALARMARRPVRHWPEVWGRLVGFFQVSEDGLWITQKRLSVELDEARAHSASQAEKARKRWSGEAGARQNAEPELGKTPRSTEAKPLKNNDATDAAASARARATPEPYPVQKEKKKKLDVDAAAGRPADRPEPSLDEQAKVAKGFEALAASLDRVVADVGAGKPAARPRVIPKSDEPVYSPAEMRALERLYPSIPDIERRIADLLRWTERQKLRANEVKLAIRRRLDKDVGEQRLAAWKQEAADAAPA